MGERPAHPEVSRRPRGDRWQALSRRSDADLAFAGAQEAADGTVAEALREAARRLADVSDTARLDAELLMAQALEVSRSEMLLRHGGDVCPPGFGSLVDRRGAHEPVAYIIGRQEFYGLDLMVTPAVLIPRADSETVIEAAREAFAGRTPPRRVLDLGTGSGALLLVALTAWPQAEGVGIDRDPRACAVALRNAERVGINEPPGRVEPERERDRARFIQRDWTRRGWEVGLGRFDLILANPPYVATTADLPASVRRFEPAGALFAGPDGLDDYRRLAPLLPALLERAGRVVLEIGSTQAAAVGALAQRAGFTTQIRCDLAGRPRALVLAIGGVGD